MYLGLFPLDSDLSAPIVLEVANVPAVPDSAPSYRVYDGDALIDNGAGFLSPADEGDVTGANTSSPITITSVAHGLTTGTIVTVRSVGGQTGANGTFKVNVLTDDTFQLIGSTSVGAYTSGGTWQVAGLYLLALSLDSGNGYDVGGTYQVLVNWTQASAARVAMFYFAVT
jgi:hypothetical protein